MNERTIHLRIKVKSLVEEAKIIRQESKKTKGMVKYRLNEHRKTIVRDHTRHNLLAYGMIKGTPYELMEKKCYEPPNFSRIATIVKRFNGSTKALEAWIEEAKEYLEKD
jgi:hypothetical protein